MGTRTQILNGASQTMGRSKRSFSLFSLRCEFSFTLSSIILTITPVAVHCKPSHDANELMIRMDSVTSIGGTTGFNPEVATKSFPSGGGFSDYVGFLWVKKMLLTPTSSRDQLTKIAQWDLSYVTCLSANITDSLIGEGAVIRSSALILTCYL